MTRRLATIVLPAAAALSLAAAAPASATVPFTTTSFPVTSPMGIAAADVDANGKTDLVTANSSDLTAGVFLGNGTGTFMPGLGSPFMIGGSASGIAAGDLNHDGRDDLVVPDYMSGISTSSTDVEVFLSSPSGFTPAATLTAGLGTSDATIADFDEDGDPDLAISNAADNTLSIFTGDGAGAFAVTPASPLAIASRDLVTGDFNDDGHVDLATMLSTGSAAVKVLLGDGAGAFTDGGSTAVGWAYNGLAATDYDSDGDLDVVASGGGINGTLVALRNDGTGALSLQSAIPVASAPSSIAAADFDADGHPDVAVTRGFGGGQIGVMMGDGAGSFATPVDWATGASPFQVISTDVDGDSRPDLVVANFGADTVSVLRNGALPAGALAPTGTQDLGEVTVGETGAGQTFTVSSSGTAALHVGTLTLAGTGFQRSADTCSDTIVPAGQTCTVTVAFAPTAAGAAGGTLTIPTDDTPFTVPLTATGVDEAGPAPTPTPTPDPTATPDPTPTATPTPPASGTPPTAKTSSVPCSSRRKITIHTPKRLRGATVTITMGKRRIGRIARAGATVTVRLTDLPRGTARVTFVTKKAREVRSFRTCA